MRACRCQRRFARSVAFGQLYLHRDSQPAHSLQTPSQSHDETQEAKRPSRPASSASSIEHALREQSFSKAAFRSTRLAENYVSSVYAAGCRFGRILMLAVRRRST